MKRETRKKTNGAVASPTPQDLTAEIARRAYEIWMNEGCCDGHDLEHWLRAERELAGERRQASAENQQNHNDGGRRGFNLTKNTISI